MRNFKHESTSQDISKRPNTQQSLVNIGSDIVLPHNSKKKRGGFTGQDWSNKLKKRFSFKK